MKNSISSFQSSEIIDKDFYNSFMDKCQELEMTIINDIEYNDTAIPPNYYVNTLNYYLRQIWRLFYGTLSS